MSNQKLQLWQYMIVASDYGNYWAGLAFSWILMLTGTERHFISNWLYLSGSNNSGLFITNTWCCPLSGYRNPVYTGHYGFTETLECVIWQPSKSLRDGTLRADLKLLVATRDSEVIFIISNFVNILIILLYSKRGQEFWWEFKCTYTTLPGM